MENSSIKIFSRDSNHDVNYLWVFIVFGILPGLALYSVIHEGRSVGAIFGLSVILIICWCIFWLIWIEEQYLLVDSEKICFYKRKFNLKYKNTLKIYLDNLVKIKVRAVSGRQDCASGTQFTFTYKNFSQTQKTAIVDLEYDEKKKFDALIKSKGIILIYE